MNTNIATTVITCLIFTLSLSAEEQSTVDLDNPAGIAYTLSDGDTRVVSVKGWSIGKKR
jgi:hypothetical protein